MAHVSLAALRALDEVAVKRLLMTTGDAARKLGVTRHGMRWLIANGDLVGERTMGGQWLFRQSTVDAVLQARATARLRRRPAVLRAAHLRLVASQTEPVQQELFTVHGGVSPAAARGVQGRKRTTRSRSETSRFPREIGRGPISGVSLPGEGGYAKASAARKRMAKVEESHGRTVRRAGRR